MDNQQPSQDYTEQEKEWDREGLLDPSWEKQQKKSFTVWVNSHLRKTGTSIETIDEDLRDGRKLLQLLEVISGEILPKPERGTMRFHKIGNVNKAVDFLEAKGVKLVSIGAEAIVDGNTKMTLGLIWTIILRFAIQDISIGELNARQGLLLWCQRKTVRYPIVKIKNFHTSWKDGLGFCALIHRHRPDLLDFHQLNKKDSIANLELAFRLAESHFDIPRMLDAEDMANSQPDEKAVITYLSCFYHYFSGMRKYETASNRICRVLNVTKEYEKMMEEYENLASELLAWINHWTPLLSNRSPHETLQEARQKLENFRNYRQHEKPSRIEDKSRLESQFNTLQTRLQLSNRSAFLPSDGHLVKEINAAWAGLENSEIGCEEWLISEIMRLEKLEHLAEKFRRKCAFHEEWAQGKEEVLGSNEWKSCGFFEIKALRKKHDIFEKDFRAHQNSVVQITDMAGELNNLRYSDIGPINARCMEICSQWELLEQLFSKRRETLVDIDNRLHSLYSDFAKRTASFNKWLDGARENLSDPVIVYKMRDIEKLIAAHNHFKSTLEDVDLEFLSINQIEHDIELLVITYDLNQELLCNPYSDLSATDIRRKWENVQNSVSERDSQLQAELKRQQNNEHLRTIFTEKANQVGPWLEREIEHILAIGLGEPGRLEDVIEQLKSIQQNVLGHKPNLQELEKLHQEMQDNFIFTNSESRYSMESLRVGWETLLTNINKTINEFDNQVLLRDSKGISEEQIAEFRASFSHFDKERVGLNPEQLRACLISVGYNIKPGSEGDEELHRVLAHVDPNGMGRVPFEAFLDFMTEENADQDSVEQMIESFGLLAAGKPFITAEELEREMPQDQAADCMARMAPSQEPGAPPQSFDYMTFSRSLYSS